MADRHKKRRWLPLLVLAVGLAFTAGVCVQIARVQAARERERFARAVLLTKSAITQRLQTYTTMLRGARGLFLASDHVNRLEFRNYIQALDLQQAYPGIQGIGYSARSPDGSIDAITALLATEHEPNVYTYASEDREAEPHAILFIEPEGGNEKAIGFNMFSEATRRAAMEHARDTGEPIASGTVTLVQEPDPASQRAFLLYLPLYATTETPPTVAERRRALRGFIYAPFRIHDLLGSIFDESDSPAEFAIYDTYDERDPEQLFASPGYVARQHDPRGSWNDLQTAGRSWRIHLVPGAQFVRASSSGLVPLVGVSGTLISLLLWGIATIQSAATERSERAAEDLRRSRTSLMESEARKSAILESAMDAIVTMDEEGRVLEHNPAAERMFSWRRDEALGRPLGDLLSDGSPGLDLPTLLACEGRRYETTARRADASSFPVEISVSRIDSNGPPRFTCFIRDITERTRAEQHRQLMTRELDHRVKNNLSMVMAILAESSRRATSLDSFVQSMTGRLRALGALHEMLAAHRWEGAELAALVDRTLAPHCPDGDRVVVSGPPVRLPGRVASAVCMALHELATNAAKYGALSSSRGNVHVRWSSEQRDAVPWVKLTWEEVDGPSVAPPEVRGFGSELIEGGIAFETGGKARVEYRPHGVVCHIEFPLERSPRTGAASPPPAPRPAAPVQ